MMPILGQLVILYHILSSSFKICIANLKQPTSLSLLHNVTDSIQRIGLLQLRQNGAKKEMRQQLRKLWGVAGGLLQSKRCIGLSLKPILKWPISIATSLKQCWIYITVLGYCKTVHGSINQFWHSRKLGNNTNLVSAM